MKKIFILFLGLLPYLPSFAQNAEDTADGRFHDDLLNHLVGTWNVASTAHGSAFTAVIKAKWVLNHQFFYISFLGNEVIPWWHVRMEYQEFIGYNRIGKRYTVHGMSIEGDADLSEGFAYGYRAGNEFKVVSKFGGDSLIVQRFVWEPVSGSWSVKSNLENSGTVGETFLEMKLVAVKPPSAASNSSKRKVR